MKILALAINYFPERTGIAPIITQRCEYLVSRGHQVEVCTGLPYYPEWKVADNYKDKSWTREIHHDVTILRSWLWAPARVTAVKRIIHEASFVASALVRALSAQKPDLLLIESPPLGLAFVAILLSKIWRVPYVYDVMDLQPDAAAELGLLPPGRLLNFLYRVERTAYRHAALVTTLTGDMAQKIVNKGVPGSKVGIGMLPAAQSAFDVYQRKETSTFRKYHGFTDDEFLVLHSGNMGVKQGLDVALRAAEVLKSENITFLLVGSGADRSRLEELSSRMALHNVRFLPVLPDEEFAAALSASDLTLVTQQKSVSDILFPSKTITYMAAGKPVLASVNSESRVAQCIREAGAGEIAAAEDSNALAERILFASRNRLLLLDWSRAAHAYALQTWHPDKVLHQYEELLMQAAGLRQPSSGELTSQSTPSH